ncbi:MAG: sulfotransferase [Gammaproteobacteria bacterium]
MTPADSSANRAPAFRRNEPLEHLLNELNTVLQGAESQLVSAYDTGSAAHPIVFVMGPLRSGTTLFMQWLAGSGLFAYPTNLMSRFYAAPVVGARLQQLLTDPQYNFRNEILDFNRPVDFVSENGKTRGALAPNEFWYFWRRFLPFGELDWLPDEELMARVDRTTLTAELRALTRVLDRPFALKGMILNYNVGFLDAVFERALFVEIRRDPVANVVSVLEARQRQFGDESTWYSFKIPEYPALQGLDPLTQAAGQIHFTRQALRAGIRKLPEHRRLVVDYEKFCAAPATVFHSLMDKLRLPTMPYSGPARFTPPRTVEAARRAEISTILAAFERTTGDGQ